MIKIYQLYLVKSYWKILFVVSIIFFSLSIILNIFEEVSFFKDVNVSAFYPLLLTFLTAPTIVIFFALKFLIDTST